MKRLVALACLAGAFPAWAADVGVGVSAKSNDSTIYVPIDFGDKFRLEPLVRHSKTTSNFGGYDSKFETLQLGVGLFGMSTLGDSIRLYYGGRLAYLDLSNERVPNFVGPPGIGDESGHGYRVSPTFGFEYMFNKHLSLGGEAEWFYEELDTAWEDRRSGTDTRLILRLRF